jgi:hypothetical protein
MNGHFWIAVASAVVSFVLWIYAMIHFPKADQPYSKRFERSMLALLIALASTFVFAIAGVVKARYGS